MVTTTGDIPPKKDVRPHGSQSLLEDVLDSGEVEVVLSNGSKHELHKHDTHVFDEYVYTKSGDDDVWFALDDVVEVSRHYE